MATGTALSCFRGTAGEAGRIQSLGMEGSSALRSACCRLPPSHSNVLDSTASDIVAQEIRPQRGGDGAPRSHELPRPLSTPISSRLVRPTQFR